MNEVLARARPLADEPRQRPALEIVRAPGIEPVPSWRGVTHEKGFALAPALAFVLVASADGPRAKAAAAVFAGTLTVMLGASALNHRGVLGSRWQPWLRRLDHSAINLFIAGTWTAVALVALSGTTRVVLTAVVWGGAVVASAITIRWVEVPGWITASIAMGVGWSSAVALPALAGAVGPAGFALFLAGGVAYTVGGVIYATQRPSPHPAFGFHELFHAPILVGAACHYGALAFFFLPLAE